MYLYIYDIMPICIQYIFVCMYTIDVCMYSLHTNMGVCIADVQVGPM